MKQLAIRYKASLIFLQVLKPPTRTDYATAHTNLFENQLDDQVREADKYIDGHKGQFMETNIQSRTRIAFGSVVKAILRVAEQEKADLITLCSYGRGGLSRLFYGSVAVGVLNRFDRPLLVIRARNNIE